VPSRVWGAASVSRTSKRNLGKRRGSDRARLRVFPDSPSLVHSSSEIRFLAFRQTSKWCPRRPGVMSGQLQLLADKGTIGSVRTSEHPRATVAVARMIVCPSRRNFSLTSALVDPPLKGHPHPIRPVDTIMPLAPVLSNRVRSKCIYGVLLKAWTGPLPLEERASDFKSTIWISVWNGRNVVARVDRQTPAVARSGPESWNRRVRNGYARGAEPTFWLSPPRPTTRPEG